MKRFLGFALTLVFILGFAYTAWASLGISTPKWRSKNGWGYLIKSGLGVAINGTNDNAPAWIDSTGNASFKNISAVTISPAPAAGPHLFFSSSHSDLNSVGGLVSGVYYSILYSTDSQWYLDTTTTSGAGDFLADGSVTMTGDLNMGAQALTNVGNVDGVDVSVQVGETIMAIEGDSISQTPTLGRVNWPYQMGGLSPTFNRATRHNFATGGTTTAVMVSTYGVSAGSVAPTEDTDDAYFFLMGGTNDVGQATTASIIYGNLSSLWASARADNYKVLAFTVLPSTAWTDGSAKEAIRDDLNALILSDPTLYDYVVLADVVLPDPADTTYYLDGTHPTPAGSLFISHAVAQALDKYQPYNVVSGTSYATTYNSMDLILNPQGRRVGIGTFTPDYTLDVEGTFGVSGTVTFIGDVYHGSGASALVVALAENTVNETNAMAIRIDTGGGPHVESRKNFTWRYNTGDVSGTRDFVIIEGTDAPQTVLVLRGGDDLGKAGFFDSSPDYRFEVSGTSGNGYFGLSEASDGDIFEVDENGVVSMPFGSNELYYIPQSSEATTTEGTVAYDDGTGWSGGSEGLKEYKNGAWVALDKQGDFLADGSVTATGAFNLGAYGLTNTGPITGATTGSFSSTVTFDGDLMTDRWLDSGTNTLIGANVAGQDSLTHGTGSEGWHNTALGSSALYRITYGVGNIAVGYQAGYSVANGDYNVYIGEGSGMFGDSSYNTGVGYKALSNVDGGTHNVALGSWICDNITSGDYNICIGGYGIDAPSATGSNQLVIGSNGNVAISSDDMSTGIVDITYLTSKATAAISATGGQYGYSDSGDAWTSFDSLTSGGGTTYWSRSGSAIWPTNAGDSVGTASTAVGDVYADILIADEQFSALSTVVMPAVCGTVGWAFVQGSPALGCVELTGGAETNTLETTITGIESGEIFYGTGSNAGAFTAHNFARVADSVQDAQIVAAIMRDSEWTSATLTAEGKVELATTTETITGTDATRAVTPDGLTDALASAGVVDWTADQGATNIHSGNVPLAATATALAANGGNCASGEIPLGVDISGAVEGCYEPAEADITDLVHTATGITDGLIVEADLNADEAPTDNDILTYDTTGANFSWQTPGELNLYYAGGTDVAVTDGGTGTSALTDGGILLGSGTGAITALAVATNGQILIGDGATDPVLATITPGAGIDVTNGAGTITIDGETATLTNPGIAEFATTAEHIAGTDATRAATPDGVTAALEASTKDWATTGTINGLVNVTSTTAATLALTAATCASDLHVNGDNDVITYTLPTAVAGQNCGFLTPFDAAVTVDPANTGDSIILGGTTLSAGDAASSSASAGAYAYFLAIDASQWVVIGSIKTWAGP